jgi:hypothetical protein
MRFLRGVLSKGSHAFFATSLRKLSLPETCKISNRRCPGGWRLRIQSEGGGACLFESDNSYAAGKALEVVISDGDAIVDILVWKTKHVVPGR